MNKHRLVAILVFCALLVGGSARAGAPWPISLAYHKMPARAADYNREGLAFAPYAAEHWYKGNTHCHSNTDGEYMPGHADGPPEATLAWYAEHGYDFVVLTDHNIWQGELEAPAGLLYIPGQEITHYLFHMNGLGGTGYIRPYFLKNRYLAYQHAIDETLAQGGVPVLNHPATPLAYVTPTNLRRLHDLHHFEVRNMQPATDNQVAEAMWDVLLTDGYVYYGMATDDGHFFQSTPAGIAWPPGLGFSMVDAPALSREAILEAIRVGRFYASTGVLLKRYEVRADAVEIWLDHPDPCRIEFIGAFGATLFEETGDHAAYPIGGDELYVRVRVTDPEGRQALTQPIFYR